MRPNRFGIFMPVRNGSRYLSEVVESIIAQNHEDWQLFILDNASTDGTVELVKSYRHPRIKIFESPLPLSISDSWHRVQQLLIDNHATTEFATIIGHDDILLPNFLGSIVELIAKEPNASLYHTAFDIINRHGDLVRPCRPIPERESYNEFLAARLWGLRDSVGTGYVFRSVDYLNVGGIPDLPSLLYADDILFARLSAISYKAALPKSECLYRLHRGSTSNQLTYYSLSDQIFALIKFIQILEKEFPGFMQLRESKMGLANLLAREVLVIAPVIKIFQVNCKINTLIDSIKHLYQSSSEGIKYREWLGTNFVSQYIYIFAKRIIVLKILLKKKIGSLAKLDTKLK